MFSSAFVDENLFIQWLGGSNIRPWRHQTLLEASRSHFGQKSHLSLIESFIGRSIRISGRLI